MLRLIRGGADEALCPVCGMSTGLHVRWYDREAKIRVLRWTAAGIGDGDLAQLAVAIERDLTPTIPTPTNEAVRLIGD